MIRTWMTVVLAVAMAVSQGAWAQRSRADKGKAGKNAVKEKSAADILYEEMLPSTARILVIDSLVTAKADFMSHIPLGGESGTLAAYDEYFKTSGQPGAYVYENEFGNKRYFSKSDSAGHTRLYTSDKLGGKWSEPQEVSDFGGEFEDVNSPYMMADGVTLYFTARGSGGLGGMDIYVTRYDQEAARFYKPENIGLPYNSDADEWYYVVDEFNELGWIVSGRNQPEDTVCIYTFVPSPQRDVYEGDIDDEALASLARIDRIKDTWFDEAERGAAMERLAAAREKANENVRKKDDIAFIINDEITYHYISDFRLAASRERYNGLVEMRKALDDKLARLEIMRDKYSAADRSSRMYMKNDILEAEKSEFDLREKIAREEKEIRNMEIKSL